MKQTHLFIPQRTQPPHVGHIRMLENACKKADFVTIGIGSSNKLNSSNPYTADERRLMLDYSLRDLGISNYDFVNVPDFEDDSNWVNYILTNCGLTSKSSIVSGNDWVKQIFEPNYSVIHPFEIIPEVEIEDISATRLRDMIRAENSNGFQRYAALGTQYYFEQLGGKERIIRFD